MGGEGQAVTDTVTIDTIGGVAGMGEVMQTVVAAQALGGRAEIARAAYQQGVGHVEWQVSHHLSALDVGGHHRNFAGSADVQHVVDGGRTGLQVGTAGLVAVDKQANGARYDGLAVETQQRIGSQVRACVKVVNEAKTARAHQDGPIQRAVDIVAQLVAVHVAFVVIQPISVVAQVTTVEAVDVAEIVGANAGVGDHPEAIEQTLFEQRGKSGCGTVSEVQIV